MGLNVSERTNMINEAFVPGKKINSTGDGLPPDHGSAPTLEDIKNAGVGGAAAYTDNLDAARYAGVKTSDLLKGWDVTVFEFQGGEDFE
jgi:hypothetical protein